MEQHLDGIFNTIIEMSSLFLPVGFGLAALGAIWQLGKAFAPRLYDPEAGGIDINIILKIFLIFFLLSFYDGFMGLVHTIPNIISKGTAALVDEKREAFNGSLYGTLSSEHLEVSATAQFDPSDPQLNSGSSIELYQSSNNSSEEESIFSSFTSSFSGVGTMMEKAFRGMMFTTFRIIAMMAYSVVLVLRTLFLSILFIFGPLIIGVELIPGLNGSIMHWVKSYLTIHLWLPIVYVIELISISLMELMKYNDTLVVVNENNATFTPALTSYLFLVVLILSFITVPYLANMLIGGTMSSAAASNVKKVVSAAATNGASLTMK